MSKKPPVPENHESLDEERPYTGPVKNCPECGETGLDVEDRTKLCSRCNGAGYLPDLDASKPSS